MEGAGYEYEAQAQRREGNLIHSGRVISAFALGGAVLTGLTLGSIPALAHYDMHAVGAIVGAVAGLIANVRYSF